MPPDPSADVIDSGWIRRLRPTKPVLDPYKSHGVEVEDERTAAGEVEPVGTIFLTNRECPFTCLMCDLWQYTTDTVVPEGAIETQVRAGLEKMPGVRHLKLYNAGNFFDDRAITAPARSDIARQVDGFHTLIVENHPRLVDKRTFSYASELNVERFEIAMGLETSDPFLLERLNKQMTVDDFRRSVGHLVSADIGVRAFVLLRPPFCTEEEGLEAACRSVECAFDAGVECCTVIPTRGGNGALETLASRGDFAPPTLASLEEVARFGIGLKRGRVFVDLWDIQALIDCDRCAVERIERLQTMNHRQIVPPAVSCSCR